MTLQHLQPLLAFGRYDTRAAAIAQCVPLEPEPDAPLLEVGQEAHRRELFHRRSIQSAPSSTS
jgi:hypothetical protein